jgi:hypothetical protein
MIRFVTVARRCSFESHTSRAAGHRLEYNNYYNISNYTEKFKHYGYC